MQGPALLFGVAEKGINWRGGGTWRCAAVGGFSYRCDCALFRGMNEHEQRNRQTLRAPRRSFLHWWLLCRKVLRCKQTKSPLQWKFWLVKWDVAGALFCWL